MVSALQSRSNNLLHHASFVFVFVFIFPSNYIILFHLFLRNLSVPLVEVYSYTIPIVLIVVAHLELHSVIVEITIYSRGLSVLFERSLLQSIYSWVEPFK